MPSGPKKRRAARNKLNKLSSPPNLIVSNNTNDDEMIPKVTSVEHESKDDEPQVKEVTKEDHHDLLVECDHNAVGAGGRVEEEDNNGVKGDKPADAQKGYDDGGVSSEADNAACRLRLPDMKVTLGGFKDDEECPLKEYHEMMIPKVAQSVLEIPHDHDDEGVDKTSVKHAAPDHGHGQVKEAEDDDNAVLKVESAADGCVEDDNNALTGNETAHAEYQDAGGMSEVVAAAAEDDKGTFGWKKEEWDFGVVKELLCGGFKDECAFEEYFGKVMAMVDELCDGHEGATAAKALLLLHKHLIKKGALI